MKGAVAGTPLHPTSIANKKGLPADASVSFEAVTAFGEQSTIRSPALSTGPAATDDDSHLMLPRKSFLLKDLLSQQPTAYIPKYVQERASLPPERWVRTNAKGQWSPVGNPRATTPSLVIPGYTPKKLSWEDVDVQEDRSLVLTESVVLNATTPIKGLALPLVSTTSPSRGVAPLHPAPSPSSQAPPVASTSTKAPQSKSTKQSPHQQRATASIQGTPLSHGVQDAWVSSHVQLGPFRNLVIYQHTQPSDSEARIPLELLPPANVKLTPLEQHRVQHAQREHTRQHTPSATRGHVSSSIARTSHVGLPGGYRPQSRQAHSPGQRSSPSSAASEWSPSQSRSPGGPTQVHPPMHYALPSSVVLPLPAPVQHPSQLPVRCTGGTPKQTCGRCDGPMQQSERAECPVCAEVDEELRKFDAVRESKEEGLYEHQLELWREQQAREEEAKLIPPDMMRTKSGRLVKRLIILDEGPTIAQLYHGTTHEDREILYVSACGGLSFDITKDRFFSLVQKVLAPRIHVRVNDDQAALMFQIFDVDNNGFVSYLEYLATLTSQLLTTDQRTFLDQLFDQLYRRPFVSEATDAKTATKLLQAQQAQMQLDGAMNNSTEAVGDGGGGDIALSPSSGGGASPLRRKNSGSQHQLLRRRSTRLMRMSSVVDAMASSGFADSFGRGSKSKANQKPQLYLTKSHITSERLKHCIYDLKQHNPWFPHPLNDVLAASIVHCFRALQEEDRINLHKFKMFIFCDDECMPALEALIPHE